MKNSSLIKLLLASTTLLNTIPSHAADYQTVPGVYIAREAYPEISLSTHGQIGILRDNALAPVNWATINADANATLVLDGNHTIFNIAPVMRQNVVVNERWKGQPNFVVANELKFANLKMIAGSDNNTLRIQGRIVDLTHVEEVISPDGSVDYQYIPGHYDAPPMTFRLNEIKDNIAQAISLEIGGEPSSRQFLTTRYQNGRQTISDNLLLRGGKAIFEYGGYDFGFNSVKMLGTDAELIFLAPDTSLAVPARGNILNVNTPIFSFDPKAAVVSKIPRGTIKLAQDTRFGKLLGYYKNLKQPSPLLEMHIPANTRVTFTDSTYISDLYLEEGSTLVLGDGDKLANQDNKDIVFKSSINLPFKTTLIQRTDPLSQRRQLIYVPSGFGTEALRINNPGHSVVVKEAVGGARMPFGLIEIVDAKDVVFEAGVYSKAMNIASDQKVTLDQNSAFNKVSLQNVASELIINAAASMDISLDAVNPAEAEGIIPAANENGRLTVKQGRTVKITTPVGAEANQLGQVKISAQTAHFTKNVYAVVVRVEDKSEVIFAGEQNAVPMISLAGQNSILTLGDGNNNSKLTLNRAIHQDGNGTLRINNTDKKVEIAGQYISEESKRFYNVDFQAGELKLEDSGNKVIYTKNLTIHDKAKLSDATPIDVSERVIIMDVKQIDDQLVHAVANKSVKVLEFKGNGQKFEYVSNEKLAEVMELTGENQVFVGRDDYPSPLYNKGNKNVLVRNTIQNALQDIEKGDVHIADDDHRGITDVKILRAIGVEGNLTLEATKPDDVTLIERIKGKAEGIAFAGEEGQTITIKGLTNIDSIYTTRDGFGVLELVDDCVVSGRIGDVDRKLKKISISKDHAKGLTQITGAVFVKDLELNNQNLQLKGSTIDGISIQKDSEIEFNGEANVGNITTAVRYKGTAKFHNGGKIGKIGKQNKALAFVEFKGNGDFTDNFILEGDIAAARVHLNQTKISLIEKNVSLRADEFVLNNSVLDLSSSTLDINATRLLELKGEIKLQLGTRTNPRDLGKLVLKGAACQSAGLLNLTIKVEKNPNEEKARIMKVLENQTRGHIDEAKIHIPQDQGWDKLYKNGNLYIRYTPPGRIPLELEWRLEGNAQPAEPQVVAVGNRRNEERDAVREARVEVDQEAVVGNRRNEERGRRRDRREQLQENRQNRNEERDAVREARVEVDQEAVVGNGRNEERGRLRDWRGQLQENLQNQSDERDAVREARVEIEHQYDSIFRPRTAYIGESVATSHGSYLLSSVSSMRSQPTPDDEKYVAEIATQIIEALKDSSSSVEALNAMLQSPVGSPPVEKKAQVLEYAQAVKKAASTGQLQSMIARTHSVAHDHTSPVKDLGSTVTHGLGRRLEIDVDVVDNSSISNSQFAASGDAIPGLSLWSNVLGAQSNQESLDVPGYTGSVRGFTIGGEYSRCGQKKLGIAYTRASASYSYTGDRAGDKLGFIGNVLSLYGSYNADGYFSHIIGNISRGTADTSRARIGRTASVARGSFAVRGYGLEGIIGHNFNLGGGFNFSPRAGLEYSYSHNDAYEENGAGAQNLAIDAQSSAVLSGSLGFRLAYVNEISSSTRVIPEILASIERELSNSSNSNKAVKTRFVWSDEYLNYDVSSNQNAKTSINLGGGLRIKHDIFEVSASYRYHNKLNAKYTDHQGLISIKIEL